MLPDHPELIRARWPRPHHATLLLYIGTNGVEDERQKYPPNAVEMLKLLLAAGAEVDAEADLYGGGATTPGLVATGGYFLTLTFPKTFVCQKKHYI